LPDSPGAPRLCRMLRDSIENPYNRTRHTGGQGSSHHRTHPQGHYFSAPVERLTRVGMGPFFQPPQPLQVTGADPDPLPWQPVFRAERGIRSWHNLPLAHPFFLTENIRSSFLGSTHFAGKCAVRFARLSSRRAPSRPGARIQTKFPFDKPISFHIFGPLMTFRLGRPQLRRGNS